jgi:hypothetical protein
MQFWNELEGRTIAGRYPLLRLVLSEGRTAWFATRSPSGPAILGLTEALTDAEEVTARLMAGQRLQHPNLVKIFEVGRVVMEPAEERTTLVYALMEHSDQNLADVLRDQALSRDELRQLADALVDALTEVHHRGLTHGRVEPGSVVAAGETIKLRSDCLQTGGGSRAADVAGLGGTLFQAFFRAKAASPDDPQINRAPAPFAEIIRNSLSGRWTLAQVAMALKPPANAIPPDAATLAEAGQATGAAGASASAPASSPAAPPAKEKTARIAPAAPTGIAPAAELTAEQRPAPAPVRAPAMPASVSRPLPGDHPEEGMGPRRARVAMIAGVAAILLAIVIWLLARPSPKPAGSATAVSPATLPAAKPAGHSVANWKVLPGDALPAPSRPGPPAVASENIWRVVVYTFDRKDPAERRAEEIRSQHADLQASVLTQAGPRPHYLIVIGGAMNRTQAAKLRDKAAAMGLPADAYVQNFPARAR